MSLDNQISINFTPTELDTIDQAIANLEGVLDGKLIALTPKQSQLYGKLGNETENFTNMILQDINQDANVKPSFVNVAEWEKDVAARNALMPRLTRIEGLVRRMEDTSRLLGFDIFNSALAVYNSAKYLAANNQGSARTYYERWSVQYPGGKRTGAPKKAAAAKEDEAA